MFGSLLLLTLAAPDPIAWIHDDWAKAKAAALEEKKLVAIDVWATWCHSCLSMKNFTLKEAPLAEVASTHVWLALDYDLPANAAFFARFPISAFPTFMVVDPAKDEVVARWLGSGSAAQMAAFFAGAKRDADDAVSRGHKALAAQRWEEAAKLFEGALAERGVDRARALSGYIEALWKLDPKRCAETGVGMLDDTDDTAPGIDFALLVAYCAESLDEAARKPVLAKVRTRLERAAANPGLPLSADERSGLFDSLIGIYDQLGEVEAAGAAVERRLAILEAAARAAKTPGERATFDAHRLACYLRLSRFELAEKMLLASETALPADFNHPWRLSVLYKTMGQLERASAAIERALQKGYGPRKVRLHSAKIELLVAQKKAGPAAKALDEARSYLASLDPALVRAAWVAELDEKAKAVAGLPR